MNIFRTWSTVVVVVLLLIITGFYFTQRESSNYSHEDFTITLPEREDRHTLIFTNRSEYVISPGLLVIHRKHNLLNYLEESASPGLELLAETGDPTLLRDEIATLPQQEGVLQMHTIQELAPGESVSITVDEENANAQMSYLGMIVQTNDGLVWLNSLKLYQANGERRGGSVAAELIDAGTEENTPIGSGFAGGQPDPSRGSLNLENGTASVDGVVRHHAQFYADPTKATEFFFVAFNS